MKSLDLVKHHLHVCFTPHCARMCSTSPEAEPPGFCVQLRAVLARMLANPRPLDTLFPGARPRTYTRHPATGAWRLRGEETAASEPSKQRPWGPRDFIMAFS